MRIEEAKGDKETKGWSELQNGDKTGTPGDFFEALKIREQNLVWCFTKLF